jgi:hypothetical protein
MLLEDVAVSPVSFRGFGTASEALFIGTLLVDVSLLPQVVIGMNTKKLPEATIPPMSIYAAALHFMVEMMSRLRCLYTV